MNKIPQFENNDLSFVTPKESKIEVLKGFGAKLEERFKKIFETATWSFQKNGTFSFIPSPGANLRTDLFPIEGTYSKTGNILEFQAQRQSPLEDSSSIDGIIQIDGNKVYLDFIYAINSSFSQEIVRIFQSIILEEHLENNKVQIHGVEIPSVFSLSLSGKIEKYSFSIPATIKILPTSKEDSNPFLLILSTDSSDILGSIFWKSFSILRFGKICQTTRMCFINGRVQLEIKNGNIDHKYFTWFVSMDEEVPELLNEITNLTQINRGFLNFCIKENRIFGEIQVSGISDLKKSYSYEAKFTGERIDLLPAVQHDTRDNKQESEVTFDGTWYTDAFGEIILRQKGQIVNGIYKLNGESKGIIDGFAIGSRLDFTWKDDIKGNGWGFFRRFGSRSLAGFWGNRANKNAVKSLKGSSLKLSIPILSKNPTSQDKQSLKYLGYSLINQGKHNQAIEVLEKSLELYREEINKNETLSIINVGYLIEEMDILTHLCLCYYVMYEDFYDFHNYNYLVEHFYEKLIKNLRYAVEIRHLLSQKDFAKSIFRENISQMTSLSNYIEKWRARLIDDIDKINALEHSQSFFQDLIEFLVELGFEKEALVTSEASRSRAFLDLLAGKDLAQKKSNVKFSSKKPGIPSPKAVPSLTLEEIKETVQEAQSTVIEYFLTNKHLFIWIISPSGKIEFIISNVEKSELENQVDRFLESLQHENPSTPELSSISQSLYKYLIEPIPYKLLPTCEEQVITIIPHGALFQIPFGALKSQTGIYFLEKYTIKYTSSIAVIKQNMENKRLKNPSNNLDLLALVNPKPLPNPKLRSLDFAENNFYRISELYNTCTVFKGNEATKERFREEAPKHTVIFLVTHAEISENSSLSPYIALAKTTCDEGLFETSDIFNLNLCADLVVLLACKTGVGKITGDGVIGLSRAFTWAGASSLIISLWNAPEEESLQQMYEFNEHWLTKGASKVQALRKAQLTRMKSGFNKDRIDLWAGFIIYGE